MNRSAYTFPFLKTCGRTVNMTACDHCSNSNAFCSWLLTELIRLPRVSICHVSQCSKSRVPAIGMVASVALSSRTMCNDRSPRATSLIVIVGWKAWERLRLIDNSWPVTGARDTVSVALVLGSIRYIRSPISSPRYATRRAR